MSDTLLAIVRRRFAAQVDAESQAGRVLDSLMPRAPFGDTKFSGTADPAPLALLFTADGLTVRSAKAPDLVTLELPAVPLEFTIVPPSGGVALRVEITLVTPELPVPYLRGAKLEEGGELAETGEPVKLVLPSVVLVVELGGGVFDTVRLGPSSTGGGYEVAMHPPAAFVGPETVIGVIFEKGTLTLDGAHGPAVDVPTLTVRVAPPGISALALSGAVEGLHIGLAPGDGLSGDFKLVADPASAASRPRFLRDIKTRLVLVRGVVTLLEITGRLGLDQEIAARIGQDATSEGAAHELDYRLGLTLDAGAWQAALSLGGGAQDYLWRTAGAESSGDLARNILGAYVIFAPLLVEAAPTGNGYVDLAIVAGAATGLAQSKFIKTTAVTLYDARLVVREATNGTWEAFVFFDIEAELELKADLGDVELVKTTGPVKVRHRAIGLRMEFGESGAALKLEPVFDKAQGFALDVADPGLLELPAPLGDIIQPEGVRLARENPLILELDLGLKADLGIVTVDKAGIRIPLDGSQLPSITALGAHVDVPATLSGGGYLKLEPGGIAGSLDLAILPPLGLRAQGGVAVEHLGEDVGIKLDFDVGLPVPIPLANSGLGLYGFLGLLGVNFARKTEPSESALTWLTNLGGDATKPAGWAAREGAWAFGVGAVIGTLEGGVLMNAKGMLLLELPGPRLLLFMNASLLSPRPAVGGTKLGELLAVIELSPDSLTIGVVVSYDALAPLVEIRAPAEAFFNFHDGEDWHLDIGAIPPKPAVSVKVLWLFRADGYLLIHGNGIPDFPPHPLPGFAVAAGLSVSMTWGPKPIGLYLEVAASASLGLSFKPVFTVGQLALRGALHLFIVSVEASADATVMIVPLEDYWIKARVCGSVDFFFFEISDCVTLELGSQPPLPGAEPLVAAVSLHSRARPTLHGQTTDAPVDGSLGDALAAGAEGAMPVVPIDAIPVVQMELRPTVADTCAFLGEAVAAQLAPTGWVRRGESFYRYRLSSVELSTDDAGAPVSAGDTPAVWWERSGSPGSDDDGVQLALLDWIPDPTPTAAQRSASLEERITRRWGRTCAETAPASDFLFTFGRAPNGPSTSGWTLAGLPSPDPPDSHRSEPAAALLRIGEPWRSGDATLDAVADVMPAYVYENALVVAPRTGLPIRAVATIDGELEDAFAQVPQDPDLLGDCLRLEIEADRRVTLLLIVTSSAVFDGGLLVRAWDKHGRSETVEVTWPEQVPLPYGELPERWRSDPWAMPVREAYDAFSRFARNPGLRGDEPALVEVEVDLPGLARLDIGLERDARPTYYYNWGLVAIQSDLAAEHRREDFDDTRRAEQIDVIEGALGQDPAARALLRPDTTYAVTVTYDVTVAPASASGMVDEQHAHLEPSADHPPQTFHFRTDSAPPEHLEPWVLASWPGDGEQHAFTAEPVRIVFGTGAVRSLFGAYGQSVYAVARAASGSHPPPLDALPAPSPPGTPVRAGQPSVVVPAQPVDPLAYPLDPFVSTVGTLLPTHLSCVPLTKVAVQSRRVTLPIALEPSDDYILDLEAQQGDGPYAPQPAALDPLFRRHFSTSRYASWRDLAAAIASAPVTDRRVADASILASPLSADPSGALADDELERVLRALRWGDLARPEHARVSLLWRDPLTPGSGSTAVALIVESPEPLWRSTDVPALDPTGSVYVSTKATWLDVVAGPAPFPAVSRLLHSADGARILAILAPALATQPARVGLRLRRTSPPIFEDGAPIEDAPLCDVPTTPNKRWGSPT